MIRTTRILVLALLCWGATLACRAQEGSLSADPSTVKMFTDALQQFRAEQYGEAVAIFNTLIAAKPIHQYTTASYLMAAKSYNELGEYEKAIGVMRTFLDAFPVSNYQADAHYTLGVSFLLSRQYADAALELEEAKETGTDQAVPSRAESMLQYLADAHLQYDDVLRLPTTSVGENTRSELTLLIAGKLYRSGKFDSANVLIDSLLRRRPGTSYSARADDLRKMIGRGVNVHIGVLLPLMYGEENAPGKEEAADILNGIKYALEQKRLRLPAGMNIVLDVKDSGKDPDSARAALRELAAQRDLLAVIGPMYSSTSFACASVANQDSVPLLSPTANAVGIAATGPYVFQMNPDLAMHGRAMARYAVGKSGITTLAIVAPSDESVRPLVLNFFNEAQKLGARIIDVEYYDDASEDFEEHCLRLRKAAIGGEPKISFAGKLSRDQIAGLRHYGIAQATIDSLRKQKVEIGVLTLLGPFGPLIADSLDMKLIYPPVNPRDLSKRTDMVQGVYAPVTDPENISIILSQFEYYNFKAQILGSAEWYNLTLLDANKQGAEGVVFCSDTYFDKDDPTIQAFGTGYYQANQESPNRYSMFGYDTMTLLLERLLAGASTRDALLQSLTAVQGFHGVHTNITIDNERVNSNLNILRYANSGVKRVGEISGK